MLVILLYCSSYVRYVYCKQSPKHKQRQGLHTFAIEEETKCICDNNYNNITVQIGGNFESFFQKPTYFLLNNIMYNPTGKLTSGLRSFFR